MGTQLPPALQAAIYVMAAAIVAFVAVAIPLLLQFRREMARLVTDLQELKFETKPLARDARELVDRLRHLTGRVEGGWPEVEKMLATAGRWTARADRLVDEVGAVVEPPIFASSVAVRMLRTGLGTFARALWSGGRQDQRKARTS